MNTVLITGAGGGLGSAVTKHFLQQGYRVVGTVSREEGKKEFEPHPQLQLEAVDLSSEEASANLVARLLKQHGSIEAALFLAGGFAMGSFSDTTAKAILDQISLNFETAWNTARPVFLHMLERGSGRIVFVGSRPALKPADGRKMIAYSLSKSLLFQLAEYMNAEAKGRNVSAAVVVPSTIDTPANRRSMPQADPAPWVKPADLAQILEFVVSEKGNALRETVLKVYNNA